MRMKLKTALTPLIGYSFGCVTGYTIFETGHGFLFGALLGALFGALLVYFSHNDEVKKQQKAKDFQ